MPSWKTISLAEALSGNNADNVLASGDTMLRVVGPDDWSQSALPVQFDGGQPAVFSVQLNVPSATTPEGCIFECGNRIRGAYLGFDGDGDLIWRWHNGQGNRRVVVDTAQVPRDQTITVVAELLYIGGFGTDDPVLFPEKPFGRTRLRIDLNVKAVGQLTGFIGNRWAGGHGGQVNGADFVHVGDRGQTESGNFDQEVTLSGVTFVSGLRYYRNAEVESHAKDFKTVNVLQESDFERRVSWIAEENSRVSWINSRPIRVDYANSTYHTQVVWDHNRIADIKYEDHDDHQVTQTNSRTLPVLWLDEKTAR